MQFSTKVSRTNIGSKAISLSSNTGHHLRCEFRCSLVAKQFNVVVIERVYGAGESLFA